MWMIKGFIYLRRCGKQESCLCQGHADAALDAKWVSGPPFLFFFEGTPSGEKHVINMAAIMKVERK